MARISSECTFELSIFRIQELPTSNNPDEMRCMLDVGAIGTHKAATRARATANNIEKFLKSICFSFFSAGLPAAEVFLLFSFYNVRYASMHNKNKTKTHTHTHPPSHAHTRSNVFLWALDTIWCGSSAVEIDNPKSRAARKTIESSSIKELNEILADQTANKENRQLKVYNELSFSNKCQTNNKLDNFQIKINNEIRERDIDTWRSKPAVAWSKQITERIVDVVMCTSHAILSISLRPQIH